MNHSFDDIINVCLFHFMFLSDLSYFIIYIYILHECCNIGNKDIYILIMK